MKNGIIFYCIGASYRRNVFQNNFLVLQVTEYQVEVILFQKSLFLIFLPNLAVLIATADKASSPAVVVLVLGVVPGQ